MMQRGFSAVALEFPGKHVGEMRVVTHRLAIRRLMFLTKMSAARFVARESVTTHQLSELQEICHATGALERLVIGLAVTGDGDIVPKLLP